MLETLNRQFSSACSAIPLFRDCNSTDAVNYSAVSTRKFRCSASSGIFLQPIVVAGDLDIAMQGLPLILSDFRCISGVISGSTAV